MEEYWIVNPDNKEIMVYQFQSQNIKRYKTYKINETANSFIFEGLEIEVERVFRN
ncbi:hypothetical protein [Piscibacillus sp. B03]|uniref:hypothetical protein n=1 Tax=Piscibacillus sp. B03 TaxID=3457430 RepID=UPI003FCCFE4A